MRFDCLCRWRCVTRTKLRRWTVVHTGIGQAGTRFGHGLGLIAGTRKLGTITLRRDHLWIAKALVDNVLSVFRTEHGLRFAYGQAELRPQTRIYQKGPIKGSNARR